MLLSVLTKSFFVDNILYMTSSKGFTFLGKAIEAIEANVCKKISSTSIIYEFCRLLQKQKVSTRLDLQNYARKIPCVQASSESYDLLQTSRILRNLSISNVLRLNSIWANLHLISLGKAWGLETPFNVITGSRIHQGCVFRDLLPHQGTRTAYICYINPDFEPLAKEISTQILQDILKKRLQSLRNTSFEKMVWPCDSLKEQQNG